MFSLFPSIILPVHPLLHYPSSCFSHLLHSFPSPFSRILFFLMCLFISSEIFHLHPLTYHSFLTYFPLPSLNLIFILMPTIVFICFTTFHFLEITWNAKSNETPTWCNTVQVLILQGHSTCFGRKRPSSRVFKTSTAATGTCVIVAGKSSHLLIRAGTEC